MLRRKKWLIVPPLKGGVTRILTSGIFHESSSYGPPIIPPPFRFFGKFMKTVKVLPSPGSVHNTASKIPFMYSFSVPISRFMCL
jgi:hypothetical protein